MTEFPTDPEQLNRLLDSLRFDDTVPAELPPPPGDADQVKVPRSVRWSLDLDLRMKAAAAARGLTMSQLMIQFAESGLAQLEEDQPISRAEAIRLLSGLRPLGPAT